MEALNFGLFGLGCILGMVATALSALCMEISDYFHYKALEKKKQIYLERKEK